MSDKVDTEGMIKIAGERFKNAMRAMSRNEAKVGSFDLGTGNDGVTYTVMIVIDVKPVIEVLAGALPVLLKESEGRG